MTTEQKAGFTPGPLHVGDVNDYGWSIQDEAGVCHGNVFKAADAILWAAAPDLYRAVEALHNWGQWVLTGEGPDDRQAFLDDMQSARAALARARGEQP